MKQWVTEQSDILHDQMFEQLQRAYSTDKLYFSRVNTHKSGTKDANSITLLANDGTRVLLSYNTVVACYKWGAKKIRGWYSPTTARHVSRW